MDDRGVFDEMRGLGTVGRVRIRSCSLSLVKWASLDRAWAWGLRLRRD